MHGGPTKQYLCFSTDLNIWARKILSHFESHFEDLYTSFLPEKKTYRSGVISYILCQCMISTSLYLPRQAYEFSHC